MKSTFLKSILVVFILAGVVSCKNNETQAEKEIEAAAEASETAFEYKIDTNASELKWEGSKPTATHYGTVKLSSGVLLVHDGKIEAGSFEVDMNTIVDEDLEGDSKSNLEAHLKGTAEGKEGDFFDVKKYPTANFELTGIENNIVKGNLTIKDKTNAIEFPAAIVINGDKLTFTSEAIELDRTKWGINYGSKTIFPNLGDKFVSDIMKVTISLTADKE
ncbi:YceI family protein [Aequorivita sp. H23M31]|uniref:YceI family protein n=1 Tax=Aequorivita ciconiae TaxID=2494375 RepID=A0A410G164_9FLAO|nr:YceI family protein [Aequorivita sp. H23M31]QAA80970.1 YceI family protein [Aequorivita sp. H23M31]